MKTLLLSVQVSLVSKNMSAQKILINFEEYKKLKQIEQRYHELQSELSGDK